MDHKPTAAHITVQHDVLGGKATVLRTKASGDMWQFRMWVPEEKQYVRKSLKTRDLVTAIRLGENMYLDLYSQVRMGKKLFGIRLEELISLYVSHRSTDVKSEAITAARLVTIKSQLKHLSACKGASTSLSELDRHCLHDYAQWRRTDKPSVQDETIQNEQSTINSLMKFAYRQGYANFDAFEFARLHIRDVNRRDTFTDEEYEQLVKYMRTWTAKKNVGDDALRFERLMIRDCILLASNSMLRVGELWQLRWSDVLGLEDVVDETNIRVCLTTVRVRKETAKNRKTRVITTRGGEYIKRLRDRAPQRNDGDFIFCGASGSERYDRRKFYAAWRDLMEAIGIDYKTRNLTWYSLRHFGITCRLKAGATYYDIGQIAGTSPTYIHHHYGHFDQKMSRSVALKNFPVARQRGRKM